MSADQRPLTASQRNALAMLWALGDKGPTVRTQGSMPSLVKRGLVEIRHEIIGGRRSRNWRLTETGRAEAKRICAESKRASDERRATRTAAA